MIIKKIAVFISLLQLVSLAIALCGCEPQSQTGLENRAGKRVNIEKSVNKFAGKLEPDTVYTQKQIFSRLENLLNSNLDIFGAAWAIPKENGARADVYYIYRNDDTFITRTDTDVDTSTPFLSWFRNFYRLGRPGWSQPYSVKDGFGNKYLLATYCVPLRRENSPPAAFIACDNLIQRIAAPGNSISIDRPENKTVKD